MVMLSKSIKGMYFRAFGPEHRVYFRDLETEGYVVFSTGVQNWPYIVVKAWADDTVARDDDSPKGLQAYPGW